jgi:uncharacterized membrane protein
MQRILGWLGKGLLAVVPITLTAAALVWLVTTAEGLVAPWIRWAFGAEDYVPGSGLLLVALGLVGVGMLVERVIGAWVLELVERLVDRVPLVKSFYAAVRDVLRFVVPGRGEEDSRRVVAWALREDAWMIGFVTGAPIFEPPGAAGARVSVYFPMSYQVGGYTLVLPEADLVPLELSVEDAMRTVLTAGMAGSGDR